MPIHCLHHNIPMLSWQPGHWISGQWQHTKLIGASATSCLEHRPCPALHTPTTCTWYSAPASRCPRIDPACCYLDILMMKTSSFFLSLTHLLTHQSSIFTQHSPLCVCLVYILCSICVCTTTDQTAQQWERNPSLWSCSLFTFCKASFLI